PLETGHVYLLQITHAQGTVFRFQTEILNSIR
ncbi:MAG: hypothetical protein ACI8RD_001807, partial [Bacillariaceae sp.]